MQVLLLNHVKKAFFGKSETKFWDMLFTSKGVKPEPKILNHSTIKMS